MMLFSTLSLGSDLCFIKITKLKHKIRNLAVTLGKKGVTDTNSQLRAALKIQRITATTPRQIQRYANFVTPQHLD